LISEAKGDHDGITLGLAHETFKHFISDEDTAPPKLFIDIAKASAQLASACLAYFFQVELVVSSDRFLNVSESEEHFRKSHPFFLHAANWRIHIKNARVSKDTAEYNRILTSLRHFLTIDCLKKWFTDMLAYTDSQGTVSRASQELLEGIYELALWLDNPSS
jgi:hypothetical protein